MTPDFKSHEEAVAYYDALYEAAIRKFQARDAMQRIIARTFTTTMVFMPVWSESDKAWLRTIGISPE